MRSVSRLSRDEVLPVNSTESQADRTFEQIIGVVYNPMDEFK